jgi:hypothetical protein
MNRRRFFCMSVGALVCIARPAQALIPPHKQQVLARKKLNANAVNMTVQILDGTRPRSLLVSGNSLWIDSLTYLDANQTHIQIPVCLNLPPDRPLDLSQHLPNEWEIKQMKIGFCCLPLMRSQTEIMVFGSPAETSPIANELCAVRGGYMWGSSQNRNPTFIKND